MNPLLLSDFYKQFHAKMYPEGTEYVYSNVTARGSRKANIDSVVVFGTQAFIRTFLVKNFNDNFFNVDKKEVIGEYERIMLGTVGEAPLKKEFEDLHDLGYLPLCIKGLPEGTRCPLRVPHCTIINTLPEFYWLTNFIETIMQTCTWKMLTAATLADAVRKDADRYCRETGGDPRAVDFQCHDFSMRGDDGLEAATYTGSGHLLSFLGTDTIPAIKFLEDNYYTNIDNELVGTSVPASEHSIQCTHYVKNQSDADYMQFMLDKFPTGIFSIVCDGYDYFKFLTEVLPKFKEQIMARNGKVVVRPDSGVPYHIICGYTQKELEEYYRGKGWGKDSLTKAEIKGSIEILSEIFGSTVNAKGYKELDPHIGLIYGDSITHEKFCKISERLKEMKYCSTNVVYGIGSFFYTYNTRDTFGIACKATNVTLNGKDYAIFKDPKTDRGTKKSAKGYIRVERCPEDGTLRMIDQATKEEEEKCNELHTIFLNGELRNQSTLKQIRERLRS